MSLHNNLTHILKQTLPDNVSHHEVQRVKIEYIWGELKKITLEEAISTWITSLNSHTARSYKGAMLALSKLGFLSLTMSLQEFSLLNHNIIIDSIKQLPTEIIPWSEGTKQVRAACYISLTKFLHRATSGLINIAQPSHQESTKTFYKVRDLVKTHAMNRENKQLFLTKLKTINYRDWLIAQAILQGAKRVSEVLILTTNQISFQDGTISFFQTKSRGLEKITVITYPQRFMNLLSLYIKNRSGIVFITKPGKSVGLKQVASSFAKAGKLAGILFKVTPHVLRVTAVTEYKHFGCSDSDIMKITGHSSSKMIYAYDKSARSNNASQKITLI
nr:site-specific integrase [Candidatus Chlamydia sanziniae]